MAIKTIEGVGVESLVRDPPKPLVVVKELRPLVASQRPSQRPQSPAGAQVSIAEAERSAQEKKQPSPEPAQRTLPTSPSLRFQVDKDTGKTVVSLVDTDGQVVRQMPTEEALEVAKAIGRFQGMFVDLKV